MSTMTNEHGTELDGGFATRERMERTLKPEAEYTWEAKAEGVCLKQGHS